MRDGEPIYNKAEPSVPGENLSPYIKSLWLSRYPDPATDEGIQGIKRSVNPDKRGTYCS